MKNPLGTWKLIRAEARDSTGERLAEPFGGNHAMGLLTLTREGRMMAVLCDGSTELEDNSPREYNSYCGNFTIDGARLVTTVDACVKPEYFGSRQERDVSFEEDIMVLRPPLRTYGERTEQRTLYWQRID